MPILRMKRLFCHYVTSTKNIYNLYRVFSTYPLYKKYVIRYNLQYVIVGKQRKIDIKLIIENVKEHREVTR